MEPTLGLYLIISFGVLLLTITIVVAIIINRKKFIEQRNEDFRSKGITPETFFQIRKEQIEYKLDDISGVYIIYNVTQDMYYVGQATRLYFRINQHFTGHGNGDVYADYKYGDDFLIAYIPLNDSGYSSLDALERAKIAEYNACDNGYNKTHGNN